MRTNTHTHTHNKLENSFIQLPCLSPERSEKQNFIMQSAAESHEDFQSHHLLSMWPLAPIYCPHSRVSYLPSNQPISLKITHISSKMSPFQISTPAHSIFFFIYMCVCVICFIFIDNYKAQIDTSSNCTHPVVRELFLFLFSCNIFSLDKY